MDKERSCPHLGRGKACYCARSELSVLSDGPRVVLSVRNNLHGCRIRGHNAVCPRLLKLLSRCCSVSELCEEKTDPESCIPQGYKYVSRWRPGNELSPAKNFLRIKHRV
jgi:hypothetical protein